MSCARATWSCYRAAQRSHDSICSNPIHTDEIFASTTFFKKPIVGAAAQPHSFHALFTASSCSRAAGTRPLRRLHVRRNPRFPFPRFHLHDAEPHVQSALLCRCLRNRALGGASSRATRTLFLKRCSGFERECGKAGGDMALHSNGAAFTIVSNVLLRAFLFTTLQSSEGTLLIDGEARMKAPLSLELALQK